MKSCKMMLIACLFSIISLMAGNVWGYGGGMSGGTLKHTEPQHQAPAHRPSVTTPQTNPQRNMNLKRDTREHPEQRYRASEAAAYQRGLQNAEASGAGGVYVVPSQTLPPPPPPFPDATSPTGK